jgi:hypothetical protein
VIDFIPPWLEAIAGVLGISFALSGIRRAGVAIQALTLTSRNVRFSGLSTDIVGKKGARTFQPRVRTFPAEYVAGVQISITVSTGRLRSCVISLSRSGEARMTQARTAD